MKAACACLACSGGGKRMADFFERGWIVGHYDEEASFDSDNYDQGGANQLEQMRECAESSEPYLCSLRVAKKIDLPNRKTAQSHTITSEMRKIGIIEPETAPRYAFADGEGGYQTFLVGQESKAEDAFENSSADHLYKIVPMGNNAKIIHGSKYRLNEYETPNTFSPWNTFTPQLEALYDSDSLPEMSPTSYTSDQTELLCEEYIRKRHEEFFPLIQTGGNTGTNEGIDILGEASGTTIIGEVKNKNEIDNDVLTTLRNYTVDEAEAYYFVRGGGSAKEVNVTAIETVLEELLQGHHEEMLEQMTAY